MSKQTQNSEKQADKQNKPTPTPTVEPLAGTTVLADWPIDLLGASDAPTPQGQAARLTDNRLSVVQRQAMAARLAQGQGNRYMQTVMAATKPGVGSNGGQRQTVSTNWLQPKLAVNEPGDEFEQEADAVAESVMRMPASTDPPPDDDENPSLPVQTAFRQIQTKGDDVPEVNEGLESKIGQLQGGGNPLPDEDRTFFEDRIGADFSEVRIHTGDTAVQTAQDLNARAYTVGSDIAFNSGQYQPGTDEGRRLIAHELTHVVQQGQASPAVQREAAPTEADDLPTEEEKAEALAKAEAAKGEASAAREKAQAQQGQASGEAESKRSEGEAPKSEAEASKAEGAVNQGAETARQMAVLEQAATMEAAGQAQQATATEAAQAAIGEAVAGSAASAAEARAEVMVEPVEIPVGAGAAETGAGPEGATAAATAKAETAFGGAETAPDQAPTSPQADPAYQAVAAASQALGQDKKTHEPAQNKADAAQSAAESPASELTGQAQAVQVGEMEQAETPAFDAAAFKEKLMARIEALAPQSPAEADNFKEGGEMAGVKGEMQGQVEQEKEASQGPLEAKSEESPDLGHAEPKPVTPLTEPDPGQAPASIGAEQAAPKPKGQGEIEGPLEGGSQSLDEQMADANITDEQLANSNEPEFQEALSSKNEAQQTAAQAPAEYRAAEQAEISQAQGEVTAEAQQQTEGMQSDRTGLLAQVAGDQLETKSEDEQKRDEVAGHINGIYERTKSKVETILSDLDSQVSQAFDAGAEAARRTFEDYVDRETEAYKEERYGGLLGWARWLEDKFSTNEELNAIVDRGVKQYISEMEAVIDRVIAIIGTGLSEAKAEVARGKQEVQDYVDQLPEDLQSVGQEAAQEVQGRFDELEQSIDDKQDELINTMVDKYQESLDIVNTRAEEMREANKGLIDQALDAVGSVIETILKMKEMLMSVVAAAGEVIETIISDPIGFLGNLIEAVKLGFNQFVDNIDVHLKKGLISWLTGTLAGAGITLPETFDLPGIFQLVMQMLGLSFDYIMGKLSDVLGIDVMAILDPVMQLIAIYQAEGFEGLIKFGLTKLIGEENMQQLLEVWEIIKLVMSGNFGQLWEVLQEYLDSLKETVIGEIITFVTEKVIVAGAKWVISLFNPASAFVKACMMIYDVVMFFINRGSQIVQLVRAVIDSIGNIASGNIAGAANFIENALGTAVPVAISFLSSLLGVGDLSGGIQKIITSVRGMIDNAIDSLLNSGPVQAVVGFIKNIAGKVVALAQAGFDKAKGALGFGGDEDGDEVKAGKAALRAEEQKHAVEGKITKENAEQVAANVQSTQSIFQSVRVIDGGDSWDYDYVVQRMPKADDDDGDERLEKAKAESSNSVNEARETFDTETNWNETALQEANKKLEELGGSTGAERGKWARYKQELENRKRTLEDWLPAVEQLEKRQEEAEKEANDPELSDDLKEIVIEDFEKIRNDAQEARAGIEKITRPEKPETEEAEGDNTMRFQVQWDSNGDGPTFSEVETAPADRGVTVSQAVSALYAVVAQVSPNTAQTAAEPARDKQIKWVQERPPDGVTNENYSWSEYFEYGRYTDARVDVENMRGHNLRE